MDSNRHPEADRLAVVTLQCLAALNTVVGVTLAEGDITHLHIGFKGTMNALFLKDLAEKTHRGLPGRIEDGKSAGGLCYGYRVVKTLNAGTFVMTAKAKHGEVLAIVVRVILIDVMNLNGFARLPADAGRALRDEQDFGS